MKFCKRLPVLVLAMAMPSLLLACGGDEGPGGGTDAGVDSGPTVCTTPEGSNTFVVNEVKVPLNAAEATSVYGFDLDGDESPENKVGGTLANLKSSLNVDIPAAVAGAINEGSAILLIDIQSTDLSNASCAAASVYLGANPNPAPCVDENDTVCGRHLDGSGQFDISASSPADATVLGRIINGAFEGGPDVVAGAESGTIVIELPLIDGAPPLSLSMVGARIDIAQVSADGLMEGRMGGAVPVEDVETSLLPTLHTYVEGLIARDCTEAAPNCCIDPDSAGAQVLTFFDENTDCAVPLEEMKNNALIATLLQPDVDLLDASGNYAPGSDGTDDSLSLGLGFTATTAVFTAP